MPGGRRPHRAPSEAATTDSSAPSRTPSRDWALWSMGRAIRRLSVFQLPYTVRGDQLPIAYGLSGSGDERVRYRMDDVLNESVRIGTGSIL